MTALIGSSACSNGVSGGGTDGGLLPDGGPPCGFLTACPDGGGDSGVDSGVPDAGQRPSVRAIDPPDGYTFVGRDTAVKVDVNLPNVGQGVDETTLTADNVRLLRASDMFPIDATVNTTGGGDAIVLQPRGVLDARTGYIFQLSDRVTDQGGHPFIPFTSSFSTGDFTNLKRDPRYRYAVIDPPLWNGTPIDSLVFAPDGRLYATDLLGVIRRFTLAPDGTLLNEEEWDGLAGRTLIGIVFQPDDPNVLWVTTNAPVYIQPAQDWTGTVTKVTLDPARPGFVASFVDMVSGLPRSAKDHMTNSLAFGPDGALYVTQGSTTASGAPDPTWYNRSEHLLSSALLRIDLKKLKDPINVQTEPLPPPPDDAGPPPVFGPPLPVWDGGIYDPHAADAPVTLYGEGLRNAYDLVWHSNGHLYAPTNGTAAGGNTPGSPPGVSPVVPPLFSIPTQDDFLFDVVKGGYYGHPNPTRGQYVLNGGNPTAGIDPDEVAPFDGGVGYPVGTLPDVNWKGSVYDFSRNRSPDGALESKGPAFGGALKGYLFVVEYSAGDDVLAVPIPANGGPIDRTGVLQVAEGLSDPVDITEDVNTGNLYVAQLVQGGADGGAIILLRPDGGTGDGGTQ
ncbi:MAG TPA: Ig-like domain-containing protein [Myxococcaceae bacterium]|nr:Ig-like domain-containing protein [Myxococcaceae bacterium]